LTCRALSVPPTCLRRSRVFAFWDGDPYLVNGTVFAWRGSDLAEGHILVIRPEDGSLHARGDFKVFRPRSTCSHPVLCDTVPLPLERPSASAPTPWTWRREPREAARAVTIWPDRVALALCSHAPAAKRPVESTAQRVSVLRLSPACSSFAIWSAILAILVPPSIGAQSTSN